MQIDIEIMAIALVAAASLLLLTAAMRYRRRDVALNRRVALLRDGAASVAAAERAGTPWIDALLLCVGKDREEVAGALRAADYYHKRAVTVFALLRVTATLLGGLGTALLFYDLDWLRGIGRLYPPVAAGAGFVAAKMVLRSRVNARTRHISKELPFIIDLMLLMLECGVSLNQCFRHFATWDAAAVPHSRRVMIQLVDDLAKGMAYETALERWADRMCVKGVSELASLFRGAVLHGTELVPGLQAFAQEFSDARLAAAREAIGRKTTQMTLAMIVFLMPALFIVIGGPAVSTVFKTMSELQ